MQAMAPLPPLPPSLTDPRPVVSIGILAALAGAAVLAVAGAADVWVWSCLTGAVIGMVGFGVIHARRHAAHAPGRNR